MYDCSVCGRTERLRFRLQLREITRHFKRFDRTTRSGYILDSSRLRFRPRGGACACPTAANASAYPHRACVRARRLGRSDAVRRLSALGPVGSTTVGADADAARARRALRSADRADFACVVYRASDLAGATVRQTRTVFARRPERERSRDRVRGITSLYRNEGATSIGVAFVSRSTLQNATRRRVKVRLSYRSRPERSWAAS